VLDIVILVVTCVVNLLLGLLVFLRNPKSKTSVAFLLISIFVSTWASCNYLTNLTSLSLTLNRITNSAAFFSAFLAIAFGLRFAVNFLEPTYLGFGKAVDRILTWLGVTMAILSVTPLVAGEVTRSGDALHFSVGPLLPFYIAAIVLYIALIVRTLMHIVAHSRGREKQQAIFILVGFTAAPTLALITNAIIPSVTSSWHTAAFGPLFTILLVGTISYAIVRHRLFDIRFAVALAVAYVLTILSVVGIYVFITLGIADYLLGIDINVSNAILFAVLSALTAISFQAIKEFFNKISNRVFYRDAYHPQAVLDGVSSLLVGTIDIELIKKGVEETLNSTIHPRSVAFLLTADSERLDKAMLALLKDLAQTDLNVISTDDSDKSAHTKAHNELRRHDIALAIRLRTTHESLGFLLLGYRRSGSMYTDTDIKLLGVVADELALGIQNAFRFKEIENFNATLQQKIEDATRRLRQTNTKLRTLDQTKDDFISMASHQLRTPLTSVKGYVSMVLDGDAGKITPLQRKLLTQSFISSQRMVYLISDLLNVSRLRTGKFVIEPVPSNIARVISDEVEQLVETAKGRNLELVYNKPDNFPTYMLDETKLRQVIMNFIDNAIYYTPSGGRIEINLVEKQKTIEFTVVDNGIGVSKTEQHHLFTKFFRANNAKRARPDGTGLGLFMAKKVIIAQGGAIIFRSQEGKGSTFGFTFAKDRLQEAPVK
jgi:signal transduction histidine kinase